MPFVVSNIMSFLPRHQPKRFEYKPRVFKPIDSDKETTIRFHRKTLFDTQRHAGKPAVLISAAIAVVIIIYLLGGIKAQVNAPVLTEDDIASIEVHGKKD